MSVVLAERFAHNPDWSRIQPHDCDRALELVVLIQSRSHQDRHMLADDYYGWIYELTKLLNH
ncbi:hypothetical protein [Acaryochloris sp. IP29b_bin.137]|uniref:hypothetical protein n=1 Tax=Acaryochloris sp. IP29b_bin.137 TaxID=2969217 RepID=UPI00261680CA|nr:hypothetical protein [Acaryochloris sp. IP29b_bin.137]